METYSYLIIQVLIFYVVGTSSIRIHCRNEEGKPVDWFYVYKLPKDRNHVNPLIRNGLAYMFLTPSVLKPGWKMSNLSIGDPKSVVGTTLAAMYQDPNLISLLYNDQPPQSKQPSDHRDPGLCHKKHKGKFGTHNKNKKFKLRDKYFDAYNREEICKDCNNKNKSKIESGHTKGVIVGDNITSIWLVHSVPRFPPIPFENETATSYSYPVTGTKYGQSFLCITVRTPTLEQIARQLTYNQPLIKYSHIPPGLYETLPTLVDVIQNKSVVTTPWYHMENFVTLRGRTFLSFAKSANFHDDLYSGLVARVLRSDLMVESWINGPGTLDSECLRAFQVLNVEKLNFDMANMSFYSHNDHSKWAVTESLKKKDPSDVVPAWVCVGDINRAVPQEYRGGGTVCMDDETIWENFYDLIDSVHKCN